MVVSEAALARQHEVDNKPQPKSEASDFDNARLQNAPKTKADQATRDQERQGNLPTVEIDGAAAKGEVGGASVKPTGVKRLDDSDFVVSSLKIFNRIDENNDGILSDRELALAMQDQSFRGQEAQTVAALYRGRKALGDIVDQDNPSPLVMMVGNKSEFAGISRQDLQMFDLGSMQTMQNYFEGIKLKDVVSHPEKFAAVDANHDGSLSREEVLNAATSLKDEDARRAFKDIALHFDSIKGYDTYLGRYGSSQISAADLSAYQKNLESLPEIVATRNVREALDLVSESQKFEYSRALWGDAKNPLTNITPEAVKQQTVGDCYFEAPLASLAASRPQDIQKMIKDNGDGTYTVTFPGDPESPVTVKAPTEMEFALYNAAGPYGTWASVIEKAFGQYRKDHREGDWSGQNRTPVEEADGGGPIGEAMRLLSAKPSDLHFTEEGTDEQMQNDIREALTDSPPRMVAAGSFGTSDRSRLPTGYPGHHAYSITGFRKDAAGNIFIKVRNPWGGEDKDGTSEMSWADFKKTMFLYQVERKA